MYGYLCAQALGALGRGCWHYIDQTERGQSLPSVPTSTPAADLCLFLLRMSGERHYAYVQEDNGCGFLCYRLLGFFCTQTTQCHLLKPHSRILLNTHISFCLMYEKSVKWWYYCCHSGQCFDRETLAPAGMQFCLALWMLKYQKQQTTR